MSANKFTDEFKHDAVTHVEDRGYPVRGVAERLGVSTKSTYTWQKKFSQPAKVIEEVDAEADELRRLKRDLARMTEERDILKKATAYFASAVCVHCGEPADLCGPSHVPDASGSSPTSAPTKGSCIWRS